MVDAFKDFIKNNALLCGNPKLLLAISGGVDSVVMASLFDKAGYTFDIAHCNFQLRGDESDQDETFARNLSLKYGVGFFVKKFDTNAYAATHKISIEMAARNLRYAWFHELLQQHGYEFLATAHHLNDSLETIILNLSRGTGIAGLRGIKAKRGKIIRPLLFSSKNEIETFATQQNLEYRQDNSNFSDVYRRNIIRNKVVPVLKQLNPKLEQSVNNTIERIAVAEAVFHDYLKQVSLDISESINGVVVIDPFKIDSQKQAVVAAEILKPFAFSYADTKNILEVTLADGQSGKLFYSKNYVLNIDRKKWIISSLQNAADSENAITVAQNCKGFSIQHGSYTVSIKDAVGYKIDPNPDVAALDYNKLTFPLVVRPWSTGDFFIPLGMKGKKKISDFMIDVKIALNLKKRVFVVESDGKIAWLINHRIDDRFKITKSTKEVFEIRKVQHQ